MVNLKIAVLFGLLAVVLYHTDGKINSFTLEVFPTILEIFESDGIFLEVYFFQTKPWDKSWEFSTSK